MVKILGEDRMVPVEMPLSSFGNDSGAVGPLPLSSVISSDVKRVGVGSLGDCTVCMEVHS